MVHFRRIYCTQNGQTPFSEWLENLADVVGRAKIKVRMDRILLGNFGAYRTLGAGLIELKLNFGPGYRLYAGRMGVDIIFLIGGDKSSQRKDIKQARQYWRDYKEHI